MYRTIIALIRKEFHQVFRDRMMLRVIFVMPIVQLLLLGYAITTDVKNIDMAVYDFDRSELSREYIRSLSAGDYFNIGSSELNLTDSDIEFLKNKFRSILIIPSDFSESITNFKPVKVGYVVDGTNANSAAVALGYAGVITRNFNEKVTGFKMPVKIKEKRLYNPESESVFFMVPGIVATLITMITVSMTSMAIVREREIGTLEQLMVTPITTPAFILGKIIPYAILAYMEMSLALLIGIIWFHIPFAGSWLLLYGLSFIYILATLGIGMFISTMTKTQQQAMFFAWFFSIFAILTAGFFTPISNMPQSVQYLTHLNPLRYFMTIIRAIMMKGASFDILYPEILAMCIFAVALFTLSWIRFSKRVK
ncbi:MAG: ABC transporter permease [candidate division Zixibacteria bacterium HGW-Zixibacteria-1]|nr:MAG: ABC transporter permease [candidate division Zixibacteria bacterium HGW-Zixibacteria-1]